MPTYQIQFTTPHHPMGSGRATSGRSMSAGPRGQSHLHPGAMPGVKWVLAAIYLWHAIMCRSILYHWGVPIPFRLVSQVGNSVVLGLMAIGVCLYTRRRPIRQVFTSAHRRLIYCWFILLALFAVYGFVRGNDWTVVGKEGVAFCYLAFFLILGGDDRFWAYINKPLTVLFYVSSLLVVLFAYTPMVQAVGDDVFQDFGAPIEVAHRHIFSLGYSLRPLMFSGLLLGFWGLVGKHKGLWRYLQMFAPFALFACDVGLFLFRSTGIYILLGGASYLFLRPFFERRAQSGKSILFLVVAAIGIVAFAKTDISDYVLARTFEETQKEGLFESRNAELKAYLDQAGWGALLGRGVGGGFDASGAFAAAQGPDSRQAFSNWGTLHYGILIFFLKGGIVMLALFISMLAPGLRRRSRRWYRNPCNLTAALLFPTSVLMVVTDPFVLGVEGLLFMLALMVPLSRFGTRETPQTRRLPVFSTNPEARRA